MDQKHLLSVLGFDRTKINHLFQSSDKFRLLVSSPGSAVTCTGKVAGVLFYEPSTRTSCSFQAAMQRLGGSVVLNHVADSSVQKGESFLDTVKSMACYCDVLILRHPIKGSSLEAAQNVTIPIINAGDGTGEHPTQALLDLYTIQMELGYIGGSSVDDPMVVTILGDLKHGRTAHSLVLLLGRFENVRIILVSPIGLELPDSLVESIPHPVLKMTLDEAIAITDVLYVTRIQKERFTNTEEYEAVKESYCVDSATMRKAKANMVLMHPLPRLGEISAEVDSDPRAAYFRQMRYGMFVRMAILEDILLG